MFGISLISKFNTISQKVDITRIQPVGGTHAIEVMAIGIEWAAPLDDAQLIALQQVYEISSELKNLLPLFSPSQAIVMQGVQQINIGNVEAPQAQDIKNVAPPQFVAKAAGFNLQRFGMKETPEWVASIRPEFLSCNCSAYDRWRNVKPRALAIMRPFIDAALTLGARISAVGLQYQDAFRLLDGPSPAVTKELFRTNGTLLPAHLLEQHSLWHCHQGWFSMGADGRRLLNNVATEIVNVNDMDFARIGGQHRVFAASVDGSELPIVASDVERILDCLHEENIKVVNETLSDGALEVIGCSAGSV